MTSIRLADQKLQNGIREFLRKKATETSKDDYKMFHEMLIITFSRNQDKYEDLKLKYGKIVGLAVGEYEERSLGHP